MRHRQRTPSSFSSRVRRVRPARLSAFFCAFCCCGRKEKQWQRQGRLSGSGTNTHTHTERKREREGGRERQRECERACVCQRGRERVSERERERERERARERERDCAAVHGNEGNARTACTSRRRCLFLIVLWRDDWMRRAMCGYEHVGHGIYILSSDVYGAIYPCTARHAHTLPDMLLTHPTC